MGILQLAQHEITGRQQISVLLETVMSTKPMMSTLVWAG